MNDDILKPIQHTRTGLYYFLNSTKGSDFTISVQDGEFKITGYKTSTFPKVMMERTSEFTVFFIKEKCGVIVNSDGSCIPVGTYSESWEMDDFIDYKYDVKVNNRILKSIVLHSK